MLKRFDAFQIAKKYHWACKELKIPTVFYDQLFRASSSVALNLAEGSGKRTEQDQKRFYAMALGSLRECQAILELQALESPELEELGDSLGAIIYTLVHRPFQARNRSESGSETVQPTETGSAQKQF
jgi:four helix bundle protein